MKEEFEAWQKLQGGNVHWFSGDQKFADAQTQYNWCVYQAGAIAMREKAAKQVVAEYQKNRGQRIHGTGIYFEECARIILALPGSE